MDKKDILAIVVTYNPNSDTFNKLDTLTKQISDILIIDNSEDQKVRDKVECYCKEKDITCILNNENLGIAYALNVGLDFAKQKKFKWVLTLDQDSQLLDNYIEGMFEDYQKCNIKDKIAVIYPRYVDEKTKTFYREYREEDKLNAKIVITSGNFLDVNKAIEVGRFNEQLFIDEVDHDMCLRLRHKGYLLLESQNAHLFHNLGNSSSHKVFFKVIHTTNHNYVRRYYITRNNIYMIKKYYKIETTLIIKRIIFLIQDTFKILILENDKKRKFISIYRGIKDGFCNKLGSRSF